MENKNRVRRFSFNLHHNLEKQITLEKIINDFTNGWNIDYMIVGQEKTKENEVDHLQGYIEFTNPSTWEQVRERFIGLYGYVSDLQISIGDAESNFRYCSKSGDYKEYGSRTIKIKQDDIAVNVITLMRSGLDLITIMAENKNYCSYIIRNYRNLQVIEKEIRYERKGIAVDNSDLPF